MTVIVFFKQELHCGEWFGLQLREKLSVDEIGYEKMVALLTSYSNPFKGNLCQSVLLGNIVARLTIYMIRLAIILKDIEYFWMGIFKIKTFHATHGSNLGFYFIFQKSMSIFDRRADRSEV